MADRKAPQTKTAHRTALAAEDMSDVTIYLSALAKLEEQDRQAQASEHLVAREAILLAAIVVYARSFLCSRTAGEADKKLDPAVVFKDRPDLQPLHQQLCALRDEAVAHADWKYHNTSVGQTPDGSAVHRKIFRPTYTGINTQQFVELAQHVQQFCNWLGYKIDVGDRERFRRVTMRAGKP